MKPNQYVVVKQGENKPFLARVHTVNDDGKIVGVPEKDIHLHKQTVNFHRKDVKVNLGLSPMPGKAYGFDLDNLYKKTIEHDFWGKIHFFISMEKRDLNMLKASLDKTAKRVEKMGLEPYATVAETEIRAKKGKYAGMYHHSKNADRPHRVWYAPECAQGQQELMEGVIFHEFGHVVRFNGVTRNKIRNRWLRLYQSTIAPVRVPKVTVEQMLKDLGDYDEMEQSFNQVFKTLNEETPRISKAILQWMKETHRITPRELEVMWRSTKIKDIEKFWPNHTVDTHDLKPAITDYATKNVEELFAECFMFHCQKKKLPEKFQDLMDESISLAKADVVS